MNYTFCYNCGQKTFSKEIEGKQRSLCEKCDIVFYKNPIPSVAIVAINDKNEILLTKRAVEPGIGYWCLPGGFIESGETSEEAVKRELKEETNLECSDMKLLMADSVINGFWGDILILGYSAKLTSDELIAGDDAEEAKFFSFSEKPDLVFPVHENIFKKYLSKSYDKE